MSKLFAAAIAADFEKIRKIVVPKTKLNLNDLLVLAAAGEAVLKTNTALKGERRRMLRKAVNRALKFAETL